MGLGLGRIMIGIRVREGYGYCHGLVLGFELVLGRVMVRVRVREGYGLG